MARYTVKRGHRENVEEIAQSEALSNAARHPT